MPGWNDFPVPIPSRPILTAGNFARRPPGPLVRAASPESYGMAGAGFRHDRPDIVPHRTGMSVLQGRKMRHREKRTIPQGRIPASGNSRTTPHGTVRHLQPFVFHFNTYVQQGKKFVRHKRKNNRHPGKNVHDRGTNVHHRIRCPINRGGLSNTTQFPFQSWRSSNGHADRSSGDNCFFRRGLRDMPVAFPEASAFFRKVPDAGLSLWIPAATQIFPSPIRAAPFRTWRAVPDFGQIGKFF